jgi:hypothetical protein
VAQNLVEIELPKKHELLCPSAPGSLDDSILIGVVTSHPEGPRVVPMERALTVTPEILELAEPVSPTEVFRFAAACRSTKCPHFQCGACQLAARSVVLLNSVVDDLPRCPIRSACRWFRQEGSAMCMRCPQIITDQFKPYDQMLQIVFGTDPPPAEPEATS